MTETVAARAVTVTAVNSTKGYDGTTSSAATPTITAGSLVSGDTAAFTETYDTKNVGTGKTLTVAGSVNDGDGGNNYAVSVVTTTTGQITARLITVTAATSHQGLRRHNLVEGHTDGHLGQPGQGRHDGLHREL